MPELALPSGDARQQGTATAARPCPAWVPAGLSPGAQPRGSHRSRRPRADSNPTPGGLPFPQGAPAESMLAVRRVVPARLRKTTLASMGEHPPWDPRPTRDSTGACLSPGHISHRPVLGNNQEEQKKKK